MIKDILLTFRIIALNIFTVLSLLPSIFLIHSIILINQSIGVSIEHILYMITSFIGIPYIQSFSTIMLTILINKDES